MLQHKYFGILTLQVDLLNKKKIMKTLRKLFYSLLCLTIITSCEYDETPLDEDTVAGNTGAVLTTVSTTGALVNKNNPPDDSLSSTVYFNDFGNNDSMESVDVYLLFVDTTPDDNNEIQKYDEVLLETVAASSFVVGDSGYPEHTYTINNGTMLDTFGLTDDDIEGGDLFVLRYDLKLKDGRSFSAADTGTNVSTTSHRSPFRYSSSVVCFKAPEAGDWTLLMTDSYGDGWNGGYITISIDGEETTHACTGLETTETITVPAGVQRFLFTYAAGDWESENEYTLTDPNGVDVLADGPSPTEGEQFNTCED